MKNPAVDAYIEKSADFARPILKRIRAQMHKACPKIEETIKWGVPHFDYQGPIAMMAAFKQHAAFGFWKRRLLKDPDGYFSKGESGMGGRKIRTEAELPPDAMMARFIKAAVALNELGVKAPRVLKKKPPLKVPPFIAAALKKHAKARATFTGFTEAQRREYVVWIAGAKQEATRERRLATAIEWLAEGKRHNWKYENC